MQPSHPRPAVLSCSWDVHLFPTKGKVGGYLSQNPPQLHGIIWKVLYLPPCSFPAGKQPSERWEAGSRAPCPRLPGALLTPQQCHFLTGAAQPRLQHSQPCAGSPTERQETVTHPQLLGALECSSHPGAVGWDLLQLPTSGCCHPCPHHGPRINCKDEMVVLSGLSCSHPFVPVCARAILQWGPPPL